MKNDDDDMIENLFLDFDHFLLVVVMPLIMMMMIDIFEKYLMEHFAYV